MNKTILLRFTDRPLDEPTKYTLHDRTDTTMTIQYREGELMRLTLDETTGNWTNRYGVQMTVIKADRRPKPYIIKAREEGRGKPSVHKFATLTELQKYVKGRWQGVEYMDGPDGFHSDYCTFDLTGATLFDLGSIDPNDRWHWIWKELN